MGFASQFYQSRAWRRCRKSFMDSKHWLCEDCMKVGIITPATEAHHVIRLTPENINDSTVALNWNNLVAVCKPCHDARHNEAMDKHRFKVDENGKILM